MNDHIPTTSTRIGGAWTAWPPALLLLASLLVPAAAQAQPQPASAVRVDVQRVSIDHIRIASPKPYAAVKAALEAGLKRYDPRIAQMIRDGHVEDARAELERIEAPTGLTILQTLDPGMALALRGQHRNAVQYGIGNVLTATEMTQYRLAAGLYAPIRVLVYEDEAGGTVIEYDRPGSTFGMFGDKQIDAVAARLDDQLQSLFQDVTH